MPGYYPEEHERQKDARLIYEIGSLTQRLFNQDDNCVNPYRLNKTLSLIHRHWELLRSRYPEYAGIHYWRTNHFAYRFGQCVYQELPTKELASRFRLGAWFLEDIIRQDSILQKLGVRVLDDRDNDHRKGALFFPGANSVELQTLTSSIRMDPIDIPLANNLAQIYGAQRTEDIAALATCPTERDCMTALLALINIWWSDMENVIKFAGPSTLGRYDDQPNIRKHLKQAFTCGAGIWKKRELYRKSGEAAHRIIANANAWGFSGKEVSIIMELADEKGVSDAINNIALVADIMSSLVWFISQLLVNLGLQVALDEKDTTWALNHYSDALTSIGITESMRDQALANSTEKQMIFSTEVVADIRRLLAYLSTYLGALHLPASYNERALYHPEILLLD